ncbi:MAG: sigma-54-dependent Fis family transcriptional regulator [Deltaproteobacteria bacterium]|nr:sigma-54-dependent Fis family transcriptional regulator [Deltaproteobacteria bacterium]
MSETGARSGPSTRQLARILVVDDQKNMRKTLSIMLKGAGYDVQVARDGAHAMQLIDGELFDIVVTDLKLGQVDGLDVLRYSREKAPLTEVIVMTAYGTVESAVIAMKMGAHDYIQKPFGEDELLLRVGRAIERRQLSGEIFLMATEFRERYKFENIIGRSRPIREMITRIIRLAPTDTTVLITGESGTGKELVARATHANSKRADHAFVPVNCAAIAEQLLESELFGHQRGAFTGAVSARKGLFEEADGGTFFFDEIASTTPNFQAKLLRVIQDQEIRRLGGNTSIKVNARIIAATNQDLQDAIERKVFREDLYYRLNVARFHMPPLRERKEDIPLLVEHFLVKYQSRFSRTARLDEGVMDHLLAYDYPGNVRELENLIEQGVALAVGGKLRREDIPILADKTHPTGSTLKERVEITEQIAIETTLKSTHSLREAAQVLGLSQTTLWRKLKKYEIEAHED